jgi:protein arginine N-methyltransferase 1
MGKTLEENFSYLSDRVKLERYGAALQKVMRPDQVVLDLGCGSAPLGLMALRAGARKVLFVEEGPIIEAAQRTIAQAGYTGRSEFFHGNSFELSLPEPVDIVICDHIGFFGFDYGILALLADAHKRFLKSGGMIMPTSINLELAPVESEACRALVDQWRDGHVPEDYSWLAEAAANTKHAVQLQPDDLLADARTLATLHPQDATEPFLTWQAGFTCKRDGTLDGIAGWFDCELAKSIRMTNSPLAAKPLNRPQAFFPLENPITVHENEWVAVTIMARHLDDVIAWNVELPDSDLHFAHSTFNGLLLDPDAISRAHSDRRAVLNDKGRARQLVLSYCDGQRTIRQVESLVRREHPDLFPSAEATTSFIRQVLSWDTSE